MPLLQLLLNIPFLFVGFLIKYLFFLRKGFGKIYAKGLWEGIRFSFTEKAKSQKIKFRIGNLSYYFRIQIELWLRCFVK